MYAEQPPTKMPQSWKPAKTSLNYHPRNIKLYLLVVLFIYLRVTVTSIVTNNVTSIV